jgi:hypothetical protein
MIKFPIPFKKTLRSTQNYIFHVNLHLIHISNKFSYYLCLVMVDESFNLANY